MLYTPHVAPGHFLLPSPMPMLGRWHQFTIWHIDGTLVPLHHLGVEAPNILDPAILSLATFATKIH